MGQRHRPEKRLVFSFQVDAFQKVEAEGRETGDEVLTVDTAVNTFLRSKLGMSGDLVEDLK